MDDAGFDALLNAIYAVAVSPGSWPDALAAISAPFRSHTVGHVASGPDRSGARGTMFGMDAATHSAFLKRWHQHNPVGARATRDARPVVRSSAVMSPEQLQRTPMYQEFFAPHDMLFGLRLSLRSGPAGSSAVSIMRSPRRGDFDDAEVALAVRLLPHLRRADLVRTTLRQADLSTRSAWATLDAMPQPLLVLGSDRRILRANLQASKLLADSNGVRSSGGLLQVRPSDSNALERLLARALPLGGAGAQAGSLRLIRPDGAPLLLVVMPLSPDMLPGDVWDLSIRPAALVCINDPASRVQPSAALLKGLFGFTAAEASVAQLLLSGETVNSIAEASNRSVATVRTHLARLLSKAGVSRQVDLARLLASLPAWRIRS